MSASPTCYQVLPKCYSTCMSSSDVDRALALPPAEAAAALLRLPEGQWFERKSGRIAAKDAAVPLVAMANADGGVLVVGLSDGDVDGVSPKRVNELRQAAIDHSLPPVRVHVEEFSLPNSTGEDRKSVV